jgi:hypothetical protein
MVPYLYIRLLNKEVIEHPLWIATNGAPILPCKGDMYIVDKIHCEITGIVWYYHERQVHVHAKQIDGEVVSEHEAKDREWLTAVSQVGQ